MEDASTYTKQFVPNRNSDTELREVKLLTLECISHQHGQQRNFYNYITYLPLIILYMQKESCPFKNTKMLSDRGAGESPAGLGERCIG